MYPEIVESGSGKSQAILKKRSGLRAFAETTGAGRKLYQTSGGRMFSINGANVDEITVGGNVINRGTINTNSGDVSVADNGNEMVIVDGNTGFGLNLNTNVFGQIASLNFPDSATHVTFQDSYLIVNNPTLGGGGLFNISGVFDAVTWDATAGSAEGSPDAATALISTGRDLWILGPQSTQVFYNSGNADFPFDSLRGTLSDTGIQAPFSLCKMGTSIYWLGADDQGFGQVFTNQGYIPQRISNHALEQEIRTYNGLEKTTAFCYQEGGHYFYVMNFPEANRTWAFDTTTREWVRFAYTDYTNNVDGLFRGNAYAFFNGRNYTNDYANGNIYELTPDVLADDGNKIKCLRRSPHLWGGLDRMAFQSFQLDMETGVGLTTGQGIDPQLMLRWSIDGGHSFSNQHFITAGAIGNYLTRAKWNRLGMSRDRVWEVTITDPVKVTFINAYIEVT